VTEVLSTLRTPPVVGRYYLVPVVAYIYCGRTGDWPVLGPLHTDREHFNFPDAHYHVDARFLTAQQAQGIERYGKSWYRIGIAGVTGAQPLFRRGEPHKKGRPQLKRRKCRSTELPYVHGDRAPVLALRQDFADPAMPIAKTDGRLLCPHRKVDLSSLQPDEHGIVTCPLHGLRVKCGEPS